MAHTLSRSLPLALPLLSPSSLFSFFGLFMLLLLVLDSFCLLERFTFASQLFFQTDAYLESSLCLGLSLPPQLPLKSLTPPCLALSVSSPQHCQHTFLVSCFPNYWEIKVCKAPCLYIVSQGKIGVILCASLLHGHIFLDVWRF